MAFLLDTESFFALLKPEPDTHPVIAWKRGVRNEQVFVSVISVGELVDAIAAVPSPVVRSQWESRLHEHLPNAFHARILDVDLNTAREWGLVRSAQSTGEMLSAEESLLIATARVNGFSLLTRRAAHHERLGVSVIDPWSRT